MTTTNQGEARHYSPECCVVCKASCCPENGMPNGVIFDAQGGNYASRVFDMSRNTVRLVMCDDCFTERLSLMIGFYESKEVTVTWITAEQAVSGGE